MFATFFAVQLAFVRGSFEQDFPFVCISTHSVSVPTHFNTAPNVRVFYVKNVTMYLIKKILLVVIKINKQLKNLSRISDFTTNG